MVAPSHAPSSCAATYTGTLAHANLPMEARPMVTAGFKCAPLKLPTAYTATATPNAQPAVMTIHPAFWPLVLLSTTLATTPSPRMINSMVPSSSARKGGIGLNGKRRSYQRGSDLSTRGSEPEQVAQLEEERVVRAGEPPEPERLLVHHVAAVPGEHHRPRDRLIAQQHIGVEQIAVRSGSARQRVPLYENRRTGARVVPQRVGLVLDVLAHHPDEQWTRQLVFELGPQDATDIHQAAIRAPIHLLPEVADAVAEPLRGAVRHVHAQQPQIGRGPLEEVLVVALQKKSAATEMLPLGRPELDDVLAIRDRRLSSELHERVAAAGERHLEPVGRVEGGVVAERLHEVSRTHVPSAAQRRVTVEVQLLVLQMTSVNEILVLPDAVHQDVAGEPLQPCARAPVGGVARIDVRMHDARPADESAGVAKLVRDAGEHTAQTPDAMLNRELAQPQRRGRGHASDTRAAARQLQIESVDLFEDEPAVHLGDAGVVAAIDPIGVNQPDA